MPLGRRAERKDVFNRNLKRRRSAQIDNMDEIVSLRSPQWAGSGGPVGAWSAPLLPPRLRPSAEGRPPSRPPAGPLAARPPVATGSSAGSTDTRPAGPLWEGGWQSGTTAGWTGATLIQINHDLKEVGDWNKLLLTEIRSAVDRKVGGSRPPRDGLVFFS